MSHLPQDADDQSSQSSFDDVIAEYHARVDAEGPAHRAAIRVQILEEFPQPKEELLAYFADEDFAQAMAATFKANDLTQPSGERVIRYVGGYALLEMIGSGGMGDVYRARQLSTKRVVAVKLMKFTASRERFQREIEVAAKLKHDNIVTLYEAGEDNGQQFYSMAYVDGGSLANCTDSSPRQVAEWGFKLASALDYAHNHDVLHRDIKPENVLLDAQGNPLITDFGLAKLLEASHDATATKGPLGTFQYMAPEQAAGEHDRVCAASDVYSLGATLYELLAGHPPIQGPNLQQLIANIQSHEPESPCIANPGVPTDLGNVSLKCLQKNPKDRYHTAAQLADHLQLFLDNKPVPVKPIRYWTRVARWNRREPMIALLSAAIMLLLVVGVAVATFFAIRSERNAQRATANEMEAKRLGHEAVENAKRAEQSERHARTEQERAEWRLHRSNLESASDAIDNLDYDKARTILKEIAENRYGCETALVAGRMESDVTEHDIPRADSASGSSNENYCTALALAGERCVFACGTNTGLVCVWDFESRRRLDSSSHDGAVECLAMSQNGRYLAFGGSDKSVHVWSLAEERAAILGRLSGDVTAVAVSPDSDATKIAAGGDDGKVIVWDRAERRELYSFETGSEPISHIAFAPTDFRNQRFARDKYPTDIYLAVGHTDGGISLLGRSSQSEKNSTSNPCRGRVIVSNPQCHMGRVFQLEFFDGVLMSCAGDGETKWWFFDEGVRLDSFERQYRVELTGLRSGAISPTSRESIWVGENLSQWRRGTRNAHAVVIHSPITGTRTLLPQVSKAVTRDIRYPPAVVSTACNDGVFLVGFGEKVYEYLKPEYRMSFALDPTDIPVSHPAIEVAYDTIDEPKALDRSQVIRTGKLDISCGRRRLPVVAVQRAAVSHDGQFLATASAGGLVQIWDVPALWDASPPEPDRSFYVHGPGMAGVDDRIYSTVSFTRDHRYVVVGFEGNHLSVWEVASGNHVCSATLDGRAVTLDSTRASDRLLVTLADRVQLRELKTLDLIREFETSTSIACAVFDQQCERVAAACGDGKARVWRTADGELLYVLSDDGVSALRFHPSEDRLVTVGESLVIWDAMLGERLWQGQLFDRARPPYWVNFSKPKDADSRAFSIVAAAKDPVNGVTQLQIWRTAPGWGVLDEATVAADGER